MERAWAKLSEELSSCVGSKFGLAWLVDGGIGITSAACRALAGRKAGFGTSGFELKLVLSTSVIPPISILLYDFDLLPTPRGELFVSARGFESTGAADQIRRNCLESSFGLAAVVLSGDETVGR